MKVISVFSLDQLNFPVGGIYNFIVMEWRSVDGERFYNCGHCRYFETLQEAEQYKREREEKEGGENVF